MFGGLSPAAGEPMLTGSPQSGPQSSPRNYGSPGSPRTPFLPAYLLGPTHQSTPLESYRRQQQTLGGMNISHVSSPVPSHHHVTWSPDLIQRIPPSPPQAATINRFGGPPIRSLDSVDAIQQREEGGISLKRLDSSNMDVWNTNLTAAQVDPFYTQGEDFDPAKDMDDTWVTVFGFPPDAAQFILKEFSTYGTIVHHEFATKGNWVHIKYQSAMQARKALSKNGHLYAQNTIRIGVSPCIEKDIMRRYRRKTPLPMPPDDVIGMKRFKTSEPSQQSTAQTPVSSRLFSRMETSTPVRSSPLVTVSGIDNSSFIGSPASMNRSSRLGSMRSLAAAYENGRSSTSIIQTDRDVANGADGNLLTKAWKYIFSS